MDLRKLALLGAIAIAACRHGGETRPVSEAPQSPADQQGTASGQGTATGDATATPEAGEGTASTDSTTTPPDASVPQGSTGGGATDTDAYGQSGTGSGGAGSTGSPGASGMAHSDDRMIMGTVKKVSQKSIDIQDASGQSKTLQLVPETLIEGTTGGAAQLTEGQQVRASYNRQGGKDTAVRIEAIGAGSTGTGTSTDPGSSGTGTMGEPADPGTSTTPGTGTSTTPDPSGSTTTPNDPTAPAPTTPPVQQTPSGNP